MRLPLSLGRSISHCPYRTPRACLRRLQQLPGARLCTPSPDHQPGSVWHGCPAGTPGSGNSCPAGTREWGQAAQRGRPVAGTGCPAGTAMSRGQAAQRGHPRAGDRMPSGDAWVDSRQRRGEPRLCKAPRGMMRAQTTMRSGQRWPSSSAFWSCGTNAHWECFSSALKVDFCQGLSGGQSNGEVNLQQLGQKQSVKSLRNGRQESVHSLLNSTFKDKFQRETEGPT